MVYLLTCSWNSTRKEATRIVKKFNAEKPEMSELLVRSFLQSVKPASESEPKIKVSVEKEDDAPAKRDSTQNRSSIYMHAVLTCLKADSQKQEIEEVRKESLKRVLPQILLIAHHPFILPSVKYQCWVRSLAIAGFSLEVNRCSRSLLTKLTLAFRTMPKIAPGR